MGAPQTWLSIADAARVGGVSAKALRRRIERGTVVSELRPDGRRYVLVQSIHGNGAPATPPRRGSHAGQVEGQLLARLEQLAAENGRLRALTEVAESTEQRLTTELLEQRARVLELEALEVELAASGPLRAWRIARRRRRP